MATTAVYRGKPALSVVGSTNMVNTPIASAVKTANTSPYIGDWVVTILDKGLQSTALVAHAIRADRAEPYVREYVVDDDDVLTDLIPGMTVTFGASLAAGDTAVVNVTPGADAIEQQPHAILIIHNGATTADTTYPFPTLGFSAVAFFGHSTAIGGAGTSIHELYAGMTPVTTPTNEMVQHNINDIMTGFSGADQFRKPAFNGAIEAGPAARYPYLGFRFNPDTLTSVTSTIYALLTYR